MIGRWLEYFNEWRTRRALRKYGVKTWGASFEASISALTQATKDANMNHEQRTRNGRNLDIHRVSGPR